MTVMQLITLKRKRFPGATERVGVGLLVEHPLETVGITAWRRVGGCLFAPEALRSRSKTLTGPKRERERGRKGVAGVHFAWRLVPEPRLTMLD